ncbi:MAG: LysR family transcriptional regulator [OCS116 cluster bacterium]|nr:LysR family transcriptional regulator [OCS116 cluster bacterium]
MEWDDLRILLAVWRGGTASAASKELGISHATVSRRMAALERQLKVRLVDRASLSWVVTPLGEQLARLAETMEQSANEAARIAHAHGQELAGTVCISAPAITIPTLIAPALEVFRAEYPAIRLVFAAEDDIIDLPRRKADIVLRITAKPDENLIGEMICNVGWAVYGATKIADDLHHQMADKPNQLPLISLIATRPEDEFPFWAKGKIDEASPIDYVYGFAEKLELAAHGFGLTCTPCFLGDNQKGVKNVPELPWKSNANLWVLANSDTQTSARIRLVKKHLIQNLNMVTDKIEGHKSF